MKSAKEILQAHQHPQTCSLTLYIFIGAWPFLLVHQTLFDTMGTDIQHHVSHICVLLRPTSMHKSCHTDHTLALHQTDEAVCVFAVPILLQV